MVGYRTRAATETVVVATLRLSPRGFVKGVIGLGLPTVSVGLLTLVMPPAEAGMAAWIVPSFVTNVWQLAAGPSSCASRATYGRCWPASPPARCAGTGLLTGSHTRQQEVGLGLLLMLYAGLGLTSMRFSVSPAADGGSELIGALTGLVTAATGVFAIPPMPSRRAQSRPGGTSVQEQKPR